MGATGREGRKPEPLGGGGGSKSDLEGILSCSGHCNWSSIPWTGMHVIQYLLVCNLSNYTL